MTKKLFRVLVLAVGLGLVCVPAASADRTAQLVIEDNLMLNDGADATQAPGIASLWRNRLGADWVRIQAFWDAVSPNSRSRVKPRGFNVANPNSRGYDWHALDRAVSVARGAGLKILLTIHQCPPRWASIQPSRSTHCWQAKPAFYGQWARAVATRYRSSVGVYLAGTEINQKVFFQPQRNFAAADAYRNLINAAYPQIKRGDPGSKVVGLELAPIGASSRFAGNLAPLTFIKQLYCRNNAFRRIRTGPCRRYRAPRFDIAGYHPYQVKQRPDQPQRNPNLAKLGDLKRLFRTLDRASGRRYQLWITEYGYETFPDFKNGVSEALQSRYLQQAAYIVWATPRVKLYSQYLWRDDAAPSGFQTGLHFNSGSPKVALGTFPHPFWIDTKRGRNRARIWGQVRPDGVSSVRVLQGLNGGTPSTVFLTLPVDSRGYFTAVRRLPRNSNYNYQYTRGGQTFTSDTMHVS